MNTQRDRHGRYKFSDDAACACGHVFGDHRATGDDGSRPRCDSPEDQSCACERFTPASEAT